MMSTDETDSHAGAQLSQKAYLLVSLLERSTERVHTPPQPRACNPQQKQGSDCFATTAECRDGIA